MIRGLTRMALMLMTPEGIIQVPINHPESAIVVMPLLLDNLKRRIRMKKYLAIASLLPVFLLDSCLVTRSYSEKIGQFNVIQNDHPIVIDVILKNYSTPWRLSLLSDNSKLKTATTNTDSSVSVIIENLGILPLEATTYKNLLVRNAADDSVQLNINPGSKVVVFNGSLSNLSNFSYGIGLIGSNKYKGDDKIKARYYFVSSKNAVSTRGNITIKIINSDSI